MCSPFQGFNSQTWSKDVIFKILHLNMVTSKDMRLPLKNILKVLCKDLLKKYPEKKCIAVTV